MLPAVPLWGKVAAGAAALLALRAVTATRARPPPAPTPPAPTIRLGSAGPAVAYWRWVVGAAPGTSFDDDVAARTRAWQAQRHLSPDGVVGPATWAAAGISGAPAPHPPSPHPPGPAGPPSQPPPPAPTSSDPFGLASSIPDREAQILATIASGEVEHEWAPVTWSQGGKEISILASRAPVALRRGGDRLYVSVTYPTAQAIADLLGGAMPTTRISDEIWRSADVRLAPITRPWSQDGTMARTARMREQSAAIEAAIAGRPGLVANAGKLWVLTRRSWPPPAGTGVEKPQGQSGSRHNAANFGWYLASASSKSPGGEPVIQSVGLAHDMGHADYSQLVTLVRPDSLRVDGAPVPLGAALADPALSPLLQDEGGILAGTRHPDL